MFNFLAIVGIIGFIVFIVLAIISFFKKNGKAKKQFGISAGLFVLFLIGAINAPSPAEPAPEQTTEEAKNENKVEKKAKAPSTIADVQALVTPGMSDQDFKKAKNKLNVEQPKSISIGHGNTGYVLKASDGIVVAATDGNKILEVLQFATMEEVNKYEGDMLAKAKAEEAELAKKNFEQLKIKVSGNGDTATEGIPLKAGFAIFEGTHSGGSNFIVKLQDESGNNLDLLINEIGNYKGKTFADIPADGTYYLNINAGGGWNFDIYQQAPPDIPTAPTTLQGAGDDVVFFNANSGNYKFTFSHQGKSNFIVKLNGTGLMVNEIGVYNGSMRKQLGTDGVYLLNVNADGAWTANIEK